MKIARTLRLAVLAAACLPIAAPARAQQQLTVALDGSGDFTTIQAALDSIPRDNRRRVVILIQPGLYYEKLRIDANRVTLRGADRQRVQIRYNAPRAEYDKRYDSLGPAVVNVFGDDLVFQNLTVENSQTTEGHAFALYGQPNRLILDACDALGVGGDTVSLWNTAFGMYYHRNCKFKGAVDFVCPRGWCFIRDSQFEEVRTSAAIWHDGHMDPSMKFVLKNCAFDGAKDFWLGRNHYPSQFYLLDGKFSANMADKPIGTVADPKVITDATRASFERKYFHNCHRDGGDFPWHADNLATAAGSPTPDAITPAWTFDDKWDPETEAPPAVTAVETIGDAVHVYFTEPVAGAAQAQVVREDSTSAAYAAGDGTRRLEFRGGSAASPPKRLDPHGDHLYGTIATLHARLIQSQNLPASYPRKEVTILLIGDSTVATDPPDHPYQGWGAALGRMFDDRVKVVNTAKNGRSSKSFRAEGLWDKARKTPANFVFIQFGHNDNRGKGPERETDPAPGGDFRANLRRYVDEARAMGATPILVTPTTRREFDAAGRIRADEPNAEYAAAALAVAREAGCPAIDLNALTRQLFEQLGPTGSDWLQVEADRTHFSPAGARRIAALVAGQLQLRVPELQPFILPDELSRR